MYVRVCVCMCGLLWALFGKSITINIDGMDVGKSMKTTFSFRLLLSALLAAFNSEIPKDPCTVTTTHAHTCSNVKVQRKKATSCDLPVEVLAHGACPFFGKWYAKLSSALLSCDLVVLCRRFEEDLSIN